MDSKNPHLWYFYIEKQQNIGLVDEPEYFVSEFTAPVLIYPPAFSILLQRLKQ